MPLPDLAEFLATLGPFLIVEFVPKSDSQVQRLLESRTEEFPDYTEEGFQKAAKAWFNVLRREKIPGTERTLYLLERREDS